MSQVLKPCPFCGHDAEMCGLSDNSPFTWIKCSHCHAQTYKLDRMDKAVGFWNRRTESADLAAAQEREAKLSGILATVAALFDEETGTIQLGRPLHEALVTAKAALSQSSHEQARQAGGPVETTDPIENLVAELTADVQEYAEPPQLDPVHNALLHASSWIAHTPHGDNCFLMNEGEYNRCYCGRDSVLEAINNALVAVESEDHKLVPLEPTEAMSMAGGSCEPFQRDPHAPDKPYFTPGRIIANAVYRAMIAAAPKEPK